MPGSERIGLALGGWGIRALVRLNRLGVEVVVCRGCADFGVDGDGQVGSCGLFWM